MIGSGERTKPAFIFSERVVMSVAAFLALPIIAGTPEATCRLGARTQARALIPLGARTCWHVVERQCQFGNPVYVAHPIVVRAYVAEAK